MSGEDPAPPGESTLAHLSVRTMQNGSSGARAVARTKARGRPTSRLRVRSARCSGASLCVLDPAIWGSSARKPQNSSPPSAVAGLRREFSPARPPGLGGGHCALGLADAVAHEPCGGSPVQGYKG